MLIFCSRSGSATHATGFDREQSAGTRSVLLLIGEQAAAKMSAHGASRRWGTEMRGRDAAASGPSQASSKALAWRWHADRQGRLGSRLAFVLRGAGLRP